MTNIINEQTPAIPTDFAMGTYITLVFDATGSMIGITHLQTTELDARETGDTFVAENPGSSYAITTIVKAP